MNCTELYCKCTSGKLVFALSYLLSGLSSEVEVTCGTRASQMSIPLTEPRRGQVDPNHGSCWLIMSQALNDVSFGKVLNIKYSFTPPLGKTHTLELQTNMNSPSETNEPFLDMIKPCMN